MPAANPSVVAPAFPYAQLLQQPDLLDQVLAQFKRLYIRLRRRWIEQTPSGTYVHHEVTTSADRTRGWLNDRVLRDHLLGRRTIGVFHGGTTSVFSFDLDFQTEDEVIRVNLTRSFIQWLEELLGAECCHVWNTGSKGYRVEVFLTEPVTWDRLSAFYTLVLDTPWYADAPADMRYTWRSNPYLRVETRPESPTGGRGVKLPLCVDRRNGRFCTFLDPHTLQPVPDPYAYLLAIRPIRPSTLPARHASSEDIRHSSPTLPDLGCPYDLPDLTLPAEQLLAKCERLWRDGLEAPGTRHAALLLLARWHRWRKPDLSLNELESLLTSWTEREYRFRRHLIAHDRRHCLRDARSVALSAIRGRYSLSPYLNRMPLLTPEDLAALNTIRSTDQRLVLLALLLHRSLYAGQTGEFYMSYAQIAHLLGWTLPVDHGHDPLPDKARVGRAVRSLLRNHSHLIIKVKPADQPRRLATHYRILLPLPTGSPTAIPWPHTLTEGSVTLELLDTLTATQPHQANCHPLASLSNPAPLHRSAAALDAAAAPSLNSFAGESVRQAGAGACSLPAAPSSLRTPSCQILSPRTSYSLTPSVLYDCSAPRILQLRLPQHTRCSVRPPPFAGGAG